MSEWRLVATTQTTPASINDPYEVTLPCRHPDQAVKIATRMVQEIQNNAVSDAALRMKRQNAYSAEQELSKWRREVEELGFLQRFSSSLAMPNFHDIELSSKGAAWSRWTWMVRVNGDWDHKPIIAKDFPTLGMSSYRFHHKYRNHEYFYDIWSNIHYGYMGLYCGFSQDALLDGAGLEQVGTDILQIQSPTDRSAANGQGLRRFDDITDSLSIRIGYDLFDAFPDPQRLTAQILLDRIEAAPYPMEVGSKVLHDCPRARERRE